MANKSFVIQYVIKAREQFSASANKVARSSDKMRASILRSREAMQKFSLKARNVGAAISAGITLPIALMARSLKNAARDAAETQSKFTAVFGSLGKGSETMASNLSKNFGLSGTAAKKMLGDTGDLLTGFGFTAESALNLSNKVNELAVDLASFTNFSGGAEGASAALTKALLGERESLKTLGIAILESDVKRKVSKMLSEGQTFATMRQAKAAATLALAIEQSKNAIGDFARTQHELANQERITSARLQDLKESFGRVLMPAAMAATKAIRSFAKWMDKLSPTTKKVIVVIAGIVAVVGPLILLMGLLGLAIPVVASGFALLGGISLAALAPILPIIAAIAAGAFVVSKLWGRVSAVFSGFARGISSTFGPTLSHLVSNFIESAKIIASLFALDSDASKNLQGFANIAQAVGELIARFVNFFVRGLSGIASIIGQLVAAIATGDFTQFDLGAIKAEFMGTANEPRADIGGRSQTDVNVNVGLDSGLKETQPAQISSRRSRKSRKSGSMMAAAG